MGIQLERTVNPRFLSFINIYYLSLSIWINVRGFISLSQIFIRLFYKVSFCHMSDWKGQNREWLQDLKRYPIQSCSILWSTGGSQPHFRISLPIFLPLAISNTLGLHSSDRFAYLGIRLPSTNTLRARYLLCRHAYTLQICFWNFAANILLSRIIYAKRSSQVLALLEFFCKSPDSLIT